MHWELQKFTQTDFKSSVYPRSRVTISKEHFGVVSWYTQYLLSCETTVMECSSIGGMCMSSAKIRGGTWEGGAHERWLYEGEPATPGIAYRRTRWDSRFRLDGLDRICCAFLGFLDAKIFLVEALLSLPVAKLFLLLCIFLLVELLLSL